MLGSFTEEFARFLHLYFLKSQNILNVFFYFCRLYLIPLPYYRAIRARISS